MGDDRLAALATTYRKALACTEAAGFRGEIEWARGVRVQGLTEQRLLKEVAWCILNAGMRETVIRRLFPMIAECYWDFCSSDAISATSHTCVSLARRLFNHRPKLNAIVDAARRIIAVGGFEAMKQRLTAADAVAECRSFSYIGPVTAFHLARNIGIDCAKPDRHLVRFAKRWRFPDVASLCAAVAKMVNERMGVVDVVMWRHLSMGCRCAA